MMTRDIEIAGEKHRPGVLNLLYNLAMREADAIENHKAAGRWRPTTPEAAGRTRAIRKIRSLFHAA